MIDEKQDFWSWCNEYSGCPMGFSAAAGEYLADCLRRIHPDVQSPVDGRPTSWGELNDEQRAVWRENAAAEIRIAQYVARRKERVNGNR